MKMKNPAPIGLEVGSKITYTPRGTYNWKSEYSSLNPDSEKTLNSADYMYKINEWKVLDIQDEKVTLVPTTMTIGNVSLGWAQGYNNGVKLLNDACSSLYGNKSKGISARSINIEDIEKYMSVEKLEIAHKYENVAKYGEQVVEPYTSPIWYPIIYEKEKLSVIDERKNTDGLGMSEQSILIEKTENGSSDGTMMATSIQPYQTYWYKDSEFMQTAFKTASNGTNYYDLIMPEGEGTNYWLASRCISNEKDKSYVGKFGIRKVDRR